MHDPYLYDDVPILRNLLGIRDSNKLTDAEADITFFRLADVDGAISSLLFDLNRILAIHKHIFGDIYDWAGKLRVIPIAKEERVLGGDTVRYSPPDKTKLTSKKFVQSLMIQLGAILMFMKQQKHFLNSLQSCGKCIHFVRETLEA